MWAIPHNCQCEELFLKCQQNVFWHRGQVVESWGFTRGHSRGERSLKWGYQGCGEQRQRQGKRKFSDWERACRNLSAERPGEEEEESLVFQFASSSSALSPTTCCLARIFLLTIILHLAGTHKSRSAHGAGNWGLKLLLLLGQDQAATPGNRFCVHSAIEVLGAGQQCQIEGEAKALGQENILSAVPDSCLLCLWDGFAGQSSDLLHFAYTKPGIICYL